MTDRLLFVCTGNTCRSPIAEALAHERGLEAGSAGVAAQRADGATPNARRALRTARGLDLSNHTPRDIEDLDRSNFDRVVAMDPSVARRLRMEHEVDPRRLITWSISDPYGSSVAEYKRCLEQIALALDELCSEGRAESTS